MLRDYQKHLIDQISASVKKGNKRIVAVLPTGGGKTFTFSHICKGAYEKKKKALILTDRIELLNQAGGALTKFNLMPIYIKAGTKPYLGGVMYTAMVETLSRRLEKADYQHFVKGLDLIIIDECHMRSFDKLWPYFNPQTLVLGFTATPQRMGNKDVLSEYYEDCVQGVDIKWLVSKGYLSKPEYFGVKVDLGGVGMKSGDYDQNEVAKMYTSTKMYRGVVENWERLAKNTKTLVFCSNIASSQQLQDEFLDNGYNARHLDSTMKKSDREGILAWFKREPRGILLNVGILTKGFDEPSLETVVLYRATTSLPLYLQMIGRGSRTHEPTKKTTFQVLDFGDNIRRLGFWHSEREWKLKEPKKGERKQSAAVLKKCQECETFLPASAIKCTSCGYEYPKLKREAEYAELQKLDPGDFWREVKKKDLNEKVQMAKDKVVKPFWVLHNVKTFEEAQDFVKQMGWSPYWFEYNHDRFWWSKEYIEKKNNGEILIKAG